MPKSKIQLVNCKTGNSFAAAPDSGVLFSSADVGWQGITVELHRIPRLAINVSQPVHFEWKEGNRWQNTLLKTGEFSLQTHGELNFPR